MQSSNQKRTISGHVPRKEQIGRRLSVQNQIEPNQTRCCLSLGICKSDVLNSWDMIVWDTTHAWGSNFCIKVERKELEEQQVKISSGTTGTIANLISCQTCTCCWQGEESLYSWGRCNRNTLKAHFRFGKSLSRFIGTKKPLRVLSAVQLLNLRMAFSFALPPVEELELSSHGVVLVKLKPMTGNFLPKGPANDCAKSKRQQSTWINSQQWECATPDQAKNNKPKLHIYSPVCTTSSINQN